MSPNVVLSKSLRFLPLFIIETFTNYKHLIIAILLLSIYGCSSEDEQMVVVDNKVVEPSIVDSQKKSVTFYVSPKGNDSNDGLSVETAWKTSSKVNSEDVPQGFTIMFEGGNVYGALSFDENDGGDSNNRVHIESYGDVPATIQGLDFVNTSGFDINNLSVAIPTVAANDFPRNGIHIYSNLQDNKTLEGFTLSNLTISGAYTGILIQSTHDTSGFSDVLISGCTIYNCVESGIESKGYFSKDKIGYSHDNIYVMDCEIYDISGWDNPQKHSGNGIVLSDVESSSIKNSIVHDSGYDNTNCGGNCGIWYWDSKDVTIEYCEVYNIQTAGCDGAAFDLDGGVVNGIMQYNYSHDNHGAGFQVGQFLGARDMADIMVRYNISDNDANGYSGSLFIFNEAAKNSVSNISFFNNTVIQDDKLVFKSINTWNPETVQVKNNILYGQVNADNNVVFESNYYENPNLNNYQLSTSSPLVDSGVNLGFENGLRDYFGNPYLSGKSQDIGAYELK